ncbi:MAG: NFACT RNA binding domain-containing protein [Gemmatimonadota bacterium]|nr:NFACT RNA binding domain-containing protein [Gemmatimonadota bacterium]
MDSLTAHYLARELHARWGGRRVLGCRLLRRERVVIIGVAGSPAVSFDLRSAAVVVREIEQPAGEAGHLGGWLVVDVEAPMDDRRLIVLVKKPGRFRGSHEQTARLEISLVPAARGAHLVRQDGHPLASCGAEMPPPSEPRPLLSPAELLAAARTGDTAALLRGRWMSAIVATWLLAEPHSMVERYRALCELPPASPARCGAEVVPFPWCANAVPASSLIGRDEDEPEPAHDREDPRNRALARMRRELLRARTAPRLRAAANALAALGDHPVPERIVLEDGSGMSLEPRLGEKAVEAAERLFSEVRSMERALLRLPERIALMESREKAPSARPRPASRGSRRQNAPTSLPYRSYRSSGGLDIWVGRGAASNDELTFQTAAPDDVWLHARDASGAHVVLRWQHEDPPPARDLMQAAQLAAWYSRSRGSAVVPVDWTRRKYVRKPRGAAAGLVLLSRSKTLNVRPSAEVERSLRVDRDPPPAR